MIPTKTIIPRRQAHILSRPRLVERLGRHLDLALTLISAPAGYGKTALLIDFAHDAPRAVCWLSVDVSDRDLSTFVEYVVAAVRRRFPEFGQMTRAILAGNTNLQRTPAVFTAALIQDMLDTISEPFALIIDDYHLIDDSLEINALLKRLLEHRPDHLHLILASRTAPSGLPVIQLVARSQISGIGLKHLAFTAEEIRQFLKQAHKVELTPAQAQELARESEGWITGILLSREAMWRGIRDNLIRARSQEGPVYSYLAEHVFAEQTEAIQDFLLTSATLPEMTERSCREALGLTGITEVLEEVERRGVFVTSVVDDETGPSYRYHHLLREFLQERLRTRDLARFCRLHHGVADWYQAHEQWEQAVQHRLATGDTRAMAQTMGAGLIGMLHSGRLNTLVEWQRLLPESLLGEFPRILLFTGRAQLGLRELDEAMRLLRWAEDLFNEQGDTERTLLAALGRTNVWHTWGKYDQVLALAEEILTRATDYKLVTADAHRMAGFGHLYQGEAKAAADHFRASLDLYRELGETRDTAMVYSDLALVLFRLGELTEALISQERSIELFRQVGPSEEFATLLNNIAYDRYFLAGDYGTALKYLDEASQVSKAAGAPHSETLVLLTRADLFRDLGALDQAAGLYQRAEQIAQRMGDASLLNFATTGMAQLRLLSGDLTEALSLATQARDHADRLKNVYQLGLAHLTLGAVQLDTGDAVTALDTIQQGLDLLAKTGARRDLTRAYSLLGCAHAATGNREQGLEALKRGLEIAISTDTWHFLVVEGQHAYGLWKQLQQKNKADPRPRQALYRIRRLPDVAREVLGGLAPDVLPYPPVLRFRSFGSAQVERNGEMVPNSAWRSALARYLLFYLLTHPPQTRDQILAIFWPDLPADKARKNFQVVKSQTKDPLGRTLIVREDGRYSVELEPDCWFDKATFESLLAGENHRQARLEGAVRLYQGDFLADYDAEWCQTIRERLRLQFRNALVELGALYTDQNQFDCALETLMRAQEVDELYEPACHLLMQLYANKGDIPAALQQYSRLAARLNEQLGIEPGSEIQALYQALRNGKTLT
jgi:LuxR family maltose regulon positive regulatory protein